MTERFLKAKELLKNKEVTCAVVTNNEAFTSDLKGIAPLIKWLLENKNCLNSASVADRAIGKAAALLMVYGKVEEAFGIIVSQPAVEVFDLFGISYEAEKIVPHIINRAGDGICPMEQRVLNVSDPEEAYTTLKEAIEQMKKGKI